MADTMSAPVSATSASLAPIPLPTHLTRQPSKEDIELAQNLNLLINAESRHSGGREAVARGSEAEMRVEGREEVSKSEGARVVDTVESRPLEDAGDISIRRRSPSPSASQAGTPSTQHGTQASGAPITGQTCRFVPAIPRQAQFCRPDSY